MRDTQGLVGFVLARKARRGSFGWALTGGLNPVPIPLSGGGHAGEMVVAEGDQLRAVPFQEDAPWCAAVLRVDVAGDEIPVGGAFVMTPLDGLGAMRESPSKALRFGCERTVRWINRTRRHALGAVRLWWDETFGAQRAIYVKFVGGAKRGEPCFDEDLA